MQVELTERYGLRMTHILAAGAIPRLHQRAPAAALAHGGVDSDGVAMPATRREAPLTPAGRGAAGEVKQASADHRQKVAVLLDVETGPDTILAISHRGLWLRSAESTGAAPHAFASYPAARRSS
ncbi:MAG TPA: hypothetical protein VGU65_00805 [Frateuria sp.]|uniref:hypothetical protein n=1 Tax=Frateuria sp. TaxID=2211372 RepID=UPI002DE3C5F1|nr:hypothetical protein [Frateuria sp.]